MGMGSMTSKQKLFFFKRKQGFNSKMPGGKALDDVLCVNKDKADNEVTSYLLS